MPGPRGQCLIYDPQMDDLPDMQPWFVMPESDPLTRARLKTRGAAPVVLTIESDGSISGNLDAVDLETGFDA